MNRMNAGLTEEESTRATFNGSEMSPCDRDALQDIFSDRFLLRPFTSKF